MSSDKRDIKIFSDFKGVDSRSSDLSRPINAAREAKNFIIEQDYALGGERGLHFFADVLNEEPIVGSCVYKKKDLDTGRETQELLLLGKDLFRLDEGSLTITYSGSDAWGYDILVDEEDEEIRFRLFEDGAVVLDLNLGTGLEDDTTGYTLGLALASAISAVANFGVTSSNFSGMAAAAIALQSQYDIPSTTTSAIISVYRWEEVPGEDVNLDTTQGVFSPYINQHDDIDLKPPIFLNKNNCLYIVLDGTMPLMKYDGVFVRAASLLDITTDDVELVAAANSPALVGSFRYYLRFARKDAAGNFIYGTGAKTDVVTTTSGQAVRLDLFEDAVNTNGMLAAHRVSLGSDSSTNSATNTLTLDAEFSDAKLLRYGHEQVRPGDLVFMTSNMTPSSARRRVTAVDRAAKTITFDGPAITFSNAGATNVFYDNMRLMRPAVMATNSLQTGVSTITVASLDNIKVGMWLFFENEQEWFKVTGISGSDVTIDGIVDIPSGAYYIADLALEVYRTENEGLEKFFLSYMFAADPVNLGAQNFDTTADADLGAELIFPAKEPDYLRGFPSVMAQHQGVLIVGGGQLRAGRLQFEDFEFLEGFPLDTNFTDVRSQDSGVITAIWSDTYDQLAVFKDSAYYSITGTFTDEVPILNTIANIEDGLGVACQTSLLKIRQQNGQPINIGVGELGFIAFNGGLVDYDFTKQLNADFLSANVGNVLSENVKLRVNRVQAVNDRFQQQAYFLVPAFTVSGGVHTGANNNSKMYIIDYSESAWTRRTFSDVSGDSGIVNYPFWPTAGMVVYEDRLLFASCAYDSTIGNGDHTDFTSYVFRRKEREVLPTGITDYRQDYSDVHASIPYEYQPQWILVEPIEDSLFHWLKIYSFPKADFVPFSLRVRTYVDWDDGTAIDDVTLSFTSATKFKLLKLPATRAGALLFRFDTDALLTKPTITGIQIVAGSVDGEFEGVR